MENLGPPAFNPHLKRVLKSYQTVSMNSLNGPSSHVSGWADPKLSPSEVSGEYRKSFNGPMPQTRVGEEKMDYRSLPIPTQSIPLLLPLDTTRGEQSETCLEGENIACFIVGGEKRLCLPQVLNTVLNDFTLQQINAVCDELHIFCSRSNPEQLHSFKMQEVLPWSAPSCGLITKTDAERLCNALLHRDPEKASEPPSPGSFKVYHECFGKCKGIFNPELYTSSQAKCIQCVDCRGMFSPEKFVCHSHKALENRTCHWGFESSSWRSYMLLSKDQEYPNRYQNVLLEMKARFDTTNQYKRKEIHTDKDGAKRPRVEDPGSWPDSIRQLSAFRPWSPNAMGLKDGKGLGLPQYEDIQSLPGYLHRGPPVLLNPERVVPHSESTRYERHFAPNVSLAPAPYQKLKEEVDERGAKESTPIPMTSQDEDDVKPDISLPYRPHSTRSSHEELEIDVSSSDTESSIKSESPAWLACHDGTRSGLMSPASDDGVPATEKAEVDILRRAFEMNGDKDSQEKLLDEFRRLYIARNRKIISLNDQVQQELIAKNVVLRELEAVKHRLKETVERMKSEHSTMLEEKIETLETAQETKMAAALTERNSLRKEIDELKAAIKEKLDPSSDSELQAKLNIAEQSNKQLQQQVALLQEEIHRLSRATPCGETEEMETETGVRPEMESATSEANSAQKVSTAS